VKALRIRLQLGVPRAAIDLRRLATHRAELGDSHFSAQLAHAAGDARLEEAIISRLERLNTADDDNEA